MSNNSIKDKVYNQTLLGYTLTPRQNGYLNHLIPAILSFVVYTLLLSFDSAVIFRHYRDENPIWACLTTFFLFQPALCCYIFTVSDWDLWPDRQGWTLNNIKWFLGKCGQHLYFPIWAVWRYAERIFWSIEAVRNTEEAKIEEAITVLTLPRNAELYFFLASFLHSLPQMLFQLALLVRSTQDTHKDTSLVQAMSFVMNLIKLSATIAYFHRFKSQKLTGKQYPWFKEDKKPKKADNSVNIAEAVTLIYRRDLEEREKTEEPISTSRRSSGSYLEPVAIESFDEVDNAPQKSETTAPDQVDFNIKKLLNIFGLPDDDVAGKLVAFCWWFTFLLARIFAISAMFYFYPTATIGMLSAHFVIVIVFLFYDVKLDDLKHSRMLFFVFIGLVYIFCLVEFKIRFKKASMIYYGFFLLVYAENFSMCIVWMVRNKEQLENDFWFRYMFYIVAVCFLLGISCMVFYFNINKPKKVLVKKIIAN